MLEIVLMVKIRLEAVDLTNYRDFYCIATAYFCLCPAAPLTCCKSSRQRQSGLANSLLLTLLSPLLPSY